MRDWKFNHIDFSTYPYYGGNDLGVFWTQEKTSVKIWAPTAKIVEFRLYKDGETNDFFYKTHLTSNADGTWSTILNGDYEGRFYTFRINDGEWLDEIPDIYARCVGVNGIRGIIYNPEKTNPERWREDEKVLLKNYTDAIIYEVHIRDFSISESSGIFYKGKFLGFTEKDTCYQNGISTGLAHLKELGITHVHLLPVNDYYTVDEKKVEDKYNWGYDPQNFNAPEGSYSTNPYDGTTRIKELKLLVQTLHEVGIGVIFDVVYNHTYLVKKSVFNQTVPGYFYRQNGDGTFANATGCGNEIATERAMVRKYIIDSLRYWEKEFHVDGFRFDLMGVYDIETMNSIRSELPDLILYGEGWTADKSPMHEKYRAIKHNINKMIGIAAFNDDFRDAVRGSNITKRSKGFISGLALHEETVKFGIVAATKHPQIVYDYVESSRKPWADNPNQCVNYVSCHDNYTLWDKLKYCCPKASDAVMRKRVKLAGAMVIMSQGIPFLQAGVDFCRTKGGEGNSYKSSDSVNQIDWRRKKEYFDVFEYYKQLILLRKNHPVFRFAETNQIKERLRFSDEYKLGVVCCSINGEEIGDTWSLVVVIFNGRDKLVSISLPKGNFKIVVKEDFFCEEGIGEDVEGNVIVPPISMMVLKLSME